jgi:hypothetical protein
MKAFTVSDEGVIALVDGLMALPICKECLFTLKYNKQAGDSEGKKRYRIDKELQYLFHMYSWDSSYQEESEVERDISVRGYLELPDDWKMSEELNILKEEIVKVQETNLVWRSLKFARKQLYRIEELVENSDDPEVAFKYFDKLPKVITTLELIEKKFEDSKKSQVTTGGRSVSNWEMEDDDY